MRLPLAALLCVFACDGKACDVPTAPDAGTLAGRGEPCQSVWNCEVGLTCTANRCEPPGQDPTYAPCYYDWQCPSAWPPLACVNNYCIPVDIEPDASVPDASFPDAAADAAPATTSDGGAATDALTSGADASPGS